MVLLEMLDRKRIAHPYLIIQKVLKSLVKYHYKSLDLKKILILKFILLILGSWDQCFFFPSVCVN